MLLLSLLALCLGLTNASPRVDGTVACDPALRPVVVSSEPQIFASPGLNDGNLYGPNQQCEYLFQTLAGDTHLFNFDIFELEASTDCTTAPDRVEVYDGTDATGTLLGSYCGTRGGFQIAGGTNGASFIRFFSDAANEFTGFRAQFTVTGNDPCDGGIFLDDPSGWFTSPNYPSTYPNDADCSWTITPPAGSRVELSFNAFSVEDGCTGFGSIYDYVEFEEGSERRGIWWGAGPSDPNFWFGSYTAGQSTKVNFISDFTIGATGFNATYRIVPAPAY